MRKLLLATRNDGKIKEFQNLLGDSGIEVVGLSDIDIPADFDVEETGATFEENAVLKAKTYGMKSGLLTLSDDSGLEVDAFGGKPGVLSARYADGSDADRYRKLLDEMQDLPDVERKARFRCIIAIFDPEMARLETCEGEMRGTILRESRGSNGFGYDPVFLPEGFDRTSAELSVEEKSVVSHRGRAFRKAIEILREWG